MEISALSPSMSTADLKTSVGVSLLSKNLSSVEDAGAAMIQMMEQSVNPELGQNIDIKL